MEKPKFTFLLPAYKTRFFAEALRSIKSQTYTDFVCLVSDDCSPEDLKSVFDQEVGDDHRFSYRRNEQNMGSKSLVSHWNLLVDMCKTKYLIMASDDDVYEPRFLEEMNRLAEKYPEVDLLRARCDKFDLNGELLLDEFPFDEYIPCYKYNLFRFNIMYVQCMGNYIFKTTPLRNMGGIINFPLAWYSDIATTLAMSKKGMLCSHEVLFHFRTSEFNISSQWSEKVLKDKFRACEAMTVWFDSYFKKIPTDGSKLSKVYLQRVRNKIHLDWNGYFNMCCGTFSLVEIKSIIQKGKDLNVVIGRLGSFRLYRTWIRKRFL